MNIRCVIVSSVAKTPYCVERSKETLLMSLVLLTYGDTMSTAAKLDRAGSSQGWRGASAYYCCCICPHFSGAVVALLLLRLHIAAATSDAAAAAAAAAPEEVQ